MHTASPVESASQGLPIVSLREASLAHGDNLVLRCVNFLMHAGDFFYLTGRVGAGKSTLIATLTGQIPLAAGEGNVCSFDLKHLRPRDIPYLRRHLGIVFQDFKLLTDRNVYKNLHFALRATGWRKRVEIEQRIDEVLSRVGLVGKASSMPNQLSGGEQQRVAIARAMLNRPVLLLADEPTGNLDPETSEGILSLLREVAKGGTAVLMATHNYAMIHRFPSRTFHCRDGLLYEVQDPSDAGLD